MVTAVFATKNDLGLPEQTVLELTVAYGQPVALNGDAAWLDFEFQPISRLYGRPIKWEEDCEEWTRALVESYEHSPMSAAVVSDTMPRPPVLEDVADETVIDDETPILHADSEDVDYELEIREHKPAFAEEPKLELAVADEAHIAVEDESAPATETEVLPVEELSESEEVIASYEQTGAVEQIQEDSPPLENVFPEDDYSEDTALDQELSVADAEDPTVLQVKTAKEFAQKLMEANASHPDDIAADSTEEDRSTEHTQPQDESTYQSVSSDAEYSEATDAVNAYTEEYEGGLVDEEELQPIEATILEAMPEETQVVEAEENPAVEETAMDMHTIEEDPAVEETAMDMPVADEEAMEESATDSTDSVPDLSLEIPEVTEALLAADYPEEPPAPGQSLKPLSGEPLVNEQSPWFVELSPTATHQPHDIIHSQMPEPTSEKALTEETANDQPQEQVAVSWEEEAQDRVTGYRSRWETEQEVPQLSVEKPAFKEPKTPKYDFEKPFVSEEDTHKPVEQTLPTAEESVVQEPAEQGPTEEPPVFVPRDFTVPKMETGVDLDEIASILEAAGPVQADKAQGKQRRRKKKKQKADIVVPDVYTPTPVEPTDEQTVQDLPHPEWATQAAEPEAQEAPQPDWSTPVGEQVSTTENEEPVYAQPTPAPADFTPKVTIKPLNVHTEEQSSQPVNKVEQNKPQAGYDGPIIIDDNGKGATIFMIVLILITVLIFGYILL